MNSNKVLIAVSLLITLAIGCADKDQKRIQVLNNLPEMWKSEILIPDPRHPQMKVLIPLENNYDPNLMEFMKGTKKKGEYIPESIFAFAKDKVKNKPREVTLKIGDQVSVLKKNPGNNNPILYLIKTQSNTYCWIYSYHLQDANGNRISKL